MEDHEKQIERLARISQDEFAGVREELDRRFAVVTARLSALQGQIERLAEGQGQLLAAVLEIPSKRAFGRLVGKLENHADRLLSLETNRERD